MNYPKVAECGTVTKNKWPISSYRVLDQRQSPKTGCSYRLVEIGKGFETAGSAMRFTNGVFAVHFRLDGAIHGRRFKSLDDASALFNKWTH